MDVAPGGPGQPGGERFDLVQSHERIVCCDVYRAGDGVHIFAPDGKLIGKILVPETPANLCFGGANGKLLFITARKSLYSIPVRVKGVN